MSPTEGGRGEPAPATSLVQQLWVPEIRDSLKTERGQVGLGVECVA